LPDWLTSYSYAIGSSGPTQGIVSVFVVANNGHLMENNGPLVGTRNWIDHGVPPGTSGFSQSSGFGPTATSGSVSPFGHPGAYSSADYDLRIIAPAANQTGIWALVQEGGSSTFSWVQVAGSTTNPSFAVFPAASPVTGCFGVGEPCAPSTGIGVTYLNNGVRYASYYWGTTDGNPSMAGWTLQPGATSNAEGPVALATSSWSRRGVLFYLNTATNSMNVINLDTGGITALGHP
jgi:hypothetical protein